MGFACVGPTRAAPFSTLATVDTARAFCVELAGIWQVTTPVGGFIPHAAAEHEGCDIAALTGTVHMCFVLTQVAHGFVAYAAESVVGILVAFIPGFPYLY